LGEKKILKFREKNVFSKYKMYFLGKKNFSYKKKNLKKKKKKKKNHLLEYTIF
jgi:hypothetical protein